MLICLVLCAAAVLPTAISDRPEAQNVQPHPGRNNEMARRLAASYAAARNQGLLRLQNYEEGESTEEAYPYLFDTFISLWARKPYPLYSAVGQLSESELSGKNVLSRSLDQIGGGHLLRRGAILNPVVDEIGGGHLLRRQLLDQIGGGLVRRRKALDPIGGGLLLKRNNGFRALDPIGGGHLLKRDGLDEIGGGNLMSRQTLDPIGGGNLLKRQSLNSIGGGNLMSRQTLDPIGGGNLLKRQSLDSIGGGHLLKRAHQEEQEEDVAEEKLISSETDSEAYV